MSDKPETPNSNDEHPKIDVPYTFNLEADVLNMEAPSYATKLSSGMDLRSTSNYTISPGTKECVSTGLKVAIPPGFELQIRSRSGMAFRNQVFVLNSPGTIDADYRGEIRCILYNAGKEIFEVAVGDRIAQAVLCPVFQCNLVEVDVGELDKTERGSGGFGSTGTK